MRERNVEKKLRAGVKDRGGLCLKWTSPGNDGVPDRIVIMPGGRVYFAELKTDTGRLSPVQVYQLDRLMALGCDTSVIRGAEGVVRFFERLDEEGGQNGVRASRLSEAGNKDSD